MRRNSCSLILLLMLQLDTFLPAQTAAVLDYDSFLREVVSNHPMGQKSENLRSYGEIRLRAAKGSYDPLVRGSYNSKYFAGSNYFSLLNGEIRQPVFASQYIKAGYDLASGTRVNSQEITPPQGIPFLGLEVGLLRGFVIDERRADLLKAREYKKYYEADGNILLNDLLYSASEAYISWLFISGQAKVNRFFLEVSEERYKGIRELALAGERASVDTIEAGMQIQSRLMDYQSALLKVTDEANNIHFYLGRSVPVSADFLLRNSDSLDIYYQRSRDELAKVVSSDFESNPVLSRYSSYRNILAIESRYRKELIKPELNVTYNFLAQQVNSPEFTFSPNSYKWGLTLSFPLFLRNSYNLYKLSKLELSNTGLELQNKSNEIGAKIDALKKNILVLQQQLNAAELNVRLGKDLLEAEKLKFSAGESSLFLLNMRENRLLETELRLLELKAGFVIHILKIRYLNGDLNYKL